MIQQIRRQLLPLKGSPARDSWTRSDSKGERCPITFAVGWTGGARGGGVPRQKLHPRVKVPTAMKKKKAQRKRGGSSCTREEEDLQEEASEEVVCGHRKEGKDAPARGGGAIVGE